jgi:hypothetical protein
VTSKARSGTTCCKTLFTYLSLGLYSYSLRDYDGGRRMAAGSRRARLRHEQCPGEKSQFLLEGGIIIRILRTVWVEYEVDANTLDNGRAFGRVRRLLGWANIKLGLPRSLLMVCGRCAACSSERERFGGLPFFFLGETKLLLQGDLHVVPPDRRFEISYTL